MWDEQKAPDLIVELLSDSTAHTDKTEKKRIYQDRLRVAECFKSKVIRARRRSLVLEVPNTMLLPLVVCQTDLLAITFRQMAALTAER